MNKIKDLIGKHIIIGLTYVDYLENIVDRVQLHGIISKIKKEGIYVRLNNSDEEFTLPPDLSAISNAPPSEYHFKTTGEVVVNPDLMTSWTIRQPNPEEK
jgi:hypothetical protein